MAVPVRVKVDRFDKGRPGSGGVAVSPQFLIVGSHENYGVAVVLLSVEDFDD
jgi:hypothetical protein